MLKKNKYKFVLQKQDCDCGVAAVATLLLNSGYKKVNYENLGTDLEVTKNGTDYDKIESYLINKKKLKPKLFYGATLSELKKEINGGRIAIVVYQGWGKIKEIPKLEWGHYSVVVGYEDGKIYLLDPSVYEDWGDGVGWRTLDEKEFEKRWVDRDGNKLIRGWMVSVKPKNSVLE